MLENQFIQCTNYTLSMASKRQVLAICYKYYTTLYIESTVTELALLDSSGAVKMASSVSGDTQYDYNFLHMFEQGNYLSEDQHAQELPLKFNEIYYLRIRKGNSYRYSQPLLIFYSATDMHFVKYYCNNEAFGFPFGVRDPDHSLSDRSVYMWLPVRLHSPQNVQDDKTYVKANGEVVTLYAKYYKEWEGETEYLSSEMHDKIVAALSCDEVYIDGKRVTKSDKYQVDWENYDLDCDGVTKLARATFKVRENTNQRNSNF